MQYPICPTCKTPLDIVYQFKIKDSNEEKTLIICKKCERQVIVVARRDYECFDLENTLKDQIGLCVQKLFNAIQNRIHPNDRICPYLSKLHPFRIVFKWNQSAKERDLSSLTEEYQDICRNIITQIITCHYYEEGWIYGRVNNIIHYDEDGDRDRLATRPSSPKKERTQKCQ